MSYDIWLEKRANIIVEEVGNYTSNTSLMWEKALGYPLSNLDGAIAAFAIDDLKIAIENMLAEPDEYKKLNPKNGWGNYEGALFYLMKLYWACVNNPNTYITISY